MLSFSFEMVRTAFTDLVNLGLGYETASRKPCTADDIKHLFLYLLAPVSCGAAAVYTCREYPRIPGTAPRLGTEWCVNGFVRCVFVKHRVPTNTNVDWVQVGRDD